MTHLFYLLGVLFIIYEMWVIANAKNISQFVTMMRDYKKQNGKRYDVTEPRHIAFAFFNFFYLGWAITGLMSSQFIIFAALFLVSMTPHRRWIVRTINGCLSIIILAMILLNKYQLHIDFLSLLKF